MNHFPSLIPMAVAFFILATTGRLAASNTVALCGTGYGRYEREAIARSVLSEGEGIQYENIEGQLAPADFSKFALVIIATSVERPYTAAEQEVIADYLRNGGKILLIHNAPNSLADAEAREAFSAWSGLSRSGGLRMPQEFFLMKEKDPLLENAWDQDGTTPGWATARIYGQPSSSQFEVLVGNGANQALVGRHQVGKGVVYYLGHELFRLRNKSDSEADSWARLIKNIVNGSVNSTLAELQKQEFESVRSIGDAGIVLWSRRWQRGEEKGPIFEPALPRPEEGLQEVHADLAVDEEEVIQINLSAPRQGGTVRWKIHGGNLPPGAFRLFVMDAPPPIPWPQDPSIARESPYWLIPPEAVEPKQSSDFLIRPASTRVLWLKAYSHGLTPGRYQAELEISLEGRPAKSLPMTLTVHPVRVPRKRLITLMALGQVYGDVQKAVEAVRFHRNLEENGFEWSLINTLRPEAFGLNPGGQPLKPPQVRPVLDALASDQEPELDMSVLDAFVDSAVAHNLTKFIVTANLTKTIDAIATAANLNAGERDRFTQWYLRQALAYFHDNGIREIYVRYGDEMDEKELLEIFKPWAERIQRAGWLATTTLTGFQQLTPQINDALSPVVGCWTLNRIVAPHFAEALRRGEVRVLPSALVGTYGAGEGRGTEIRKNLFESRRIGWEAWALGFDHCAPNPYFKGWLYYAKYTQGRGVAGERFVAYLDKDDLEAPLLNSPFLEGIRESMEEGNLAAVLDWYLERLEKLDTTKDRALALKARAQKIISPDGPIHWDKLVYKNTESRQVGADSPAGYTQAKAKILELLTEVRPLVADHPMQGLLWNRIPLVHDGNPAALATGLPRFAQAVSQICEKECGVALPVSERLSATPVLVLVGTPGTPVISEILKEDGISPPRTRTWWIRDWKSQKGSHVIWIGGNTENDLESAVSRFSAFLQPLGHWFVEE